MQTCNCPHISESIYIIENEPEHSEQNYKTTFNLFVIVEQESFLQFHAVL